MEALEAISLASNILQFVELGAKVVKGSREIYQSANGTTKEFEHLGQTCQIISKLSAGLVPSRSPEELSDPSITSGERPIKAEIDLAFLALRCKEAADKLYQELESLRLNGSRGRAASFRQSIKNLWARSNVKDLQKTVESCRKDLMMCLTIVTAERHNSAFMRFLTTLKGANLNLIPGHLEKPQWLLHAVKTVHKQAELSSRAQENAGSTALLKSLLDVLADSATVDECWAQHRVVESLAFDYQNSRRESIPESHAETFKWILAEGHPRIKFFEWLLRGEGIYWVSGKPGSGKSTLMKFLGDRPEVREAVSYWAGDKKCVFASYYFWAAGTRLQKSLEGLLRTLLFDIFVHDPGLIRTGVPSRWKCLLGKNTLGGNAIRSLSDSEKNIPAWTVPEMLSVLEKLSVQEETEIRFCLFIDGLDEFHGDHSELVQTIQALSKGINLKICVSSRPWNVFEDTLGLDRTKRLYIHELTGSDIRRYTKAKLNSIPQWKEEASKDERYGKLISFITAKAQGVFLWVVLVVRSIQEGVSNGDSIQLLEKRLRELPTELEPFFRKILDSVPKVYHMHMALYFRLAMEAIRPFSVLLYYFLDQCIESDDHSLLLDGATPLLRNADLHKRHLIMRRRLNARCKGLLLPSGQGPKGTIMYDLDHSQNGENEYRPEYWTVGFIHRTVHDFLRTHNMQSFLDEILVDCKVNTTVLMAHAVYTKATNPKAQVGWDHLRQAIYYADKATVESPHLVFACMDEFIRLHGLHIDNQSIIELILHNNLCGYVEQQICAGSDGYTDPTQLLLSTLWAVPNPITLTEWATVLPMIEMLLNAGADVSTATVDFYLEQLKDRISDCRDEGFPKHHKAVLKLLLARLKKSSLEHIKCRSFFMQLITETWYLIPRSVAECWLDLAQTLVGQDQTPYINLCQLGDDSNKVRLQLARSGGGGKEAASLDLVTRLVEMMISAGADLDRQSSWTAAGLREILPRRAANRILQAIDTQRKKREAAVACLEL